MQYQPLNEGSVTYACSGNFPRGGVSPRFTRRPKGQSTVEYVLIIAIIGLVIVFAGPGVAGAIRNQFNLIGNTVNNGTVSGTEGGGVSGGGSTGADSATVQAAVAKDAKDWTLDEQKAVAEDIAAKGEASPAYAKAKAAMDAGTKFSMKLTDGKTLTYRIIGINHDDLADGSGKAGLTFLTTSTSISSRMTATDTNAGGTDKNAAVTATTDKLFLLSYSEIVPTSYWASSYPWTSSEGTQYEAFKGKVTQNYSGNACLQIGNSWWERSVNPNNFTTFLCVLSNGEPSNNNIAMHSFCVCPAFSF